MVNQLVMCQEKTKTPVARETILIQSWAWGRGGGGGGGRHPKSPAKFGGPAKMDFEVGKSVSRFLFSR